MNQQLQHGWAPVYRFTFPDPSCTPFYYPQMLKSGYVHPEHQRFKECMDNDSEQLLTLLQRMQQRFSDFSFLGYNAELVRQTTQGQALPIIYKLKRKLAMIGVFERWKAVKSMGKMKNTALKAVKFMDKNKSAALNTTLKEAFFRRWLVCARMSRLSITLEAGDNQYHNEIDELQANLSDRDDELAALKSQLNAKDAELACLKEKLDANYVFGLEAQCKSLDQDNGRLSVQLRAYTQSLDELKLEHLKTLDSLRDQHSEELKNLKAAHKSAMRDQKQSLTSNLKDLEASNAASLKKLIDSVKTKKAECDHIVQRMNAEYAKKAAMLNDAEYNTRQILFRLIHSKTLQVNAYRNHIGIVADTASFLRDIVDNVEMAPEVIKHLTQISKESTELVRSWYHNNGFSVESTLHADQISVKLSTNGSYKGANDNPHVNSDILQTLETGINHEVKNFVLKRMGMVEGPRMSSSTSRAAGGRVQNALEKSNMTKEESGIVHEYLNDD